MLVSNSSLCSCLESCMTGFLDTAGTIARSFPYTKDSSQIGFGAFSIAAGALTITLAIANSVRPMFQKKNSNDWEEAHQSGACSSSKMRSVSRQLGHNAPFLFIGTCAVIYGMLELFSPGEPDCSRSPTLTGIFHQCERDLC